jgi:hypothetical protein
MYGGNAPDFGVKFFWYQGGMFWRLDAGNAAIIIFTPIPVDNQY